MKSFITPTYTFDASAQTVDLSGIASFDIKRLIAIINQTTGDLIYSTASAALKFTDVTGTVVTLNYDTTAMADTDVLQIIYETNDSNIKTPVSALITLGTAGVASRVTVDGLAPSSDRVKLVVRPFQDNTGNLFIGGSTVDTTDGFPMIGPEGWTFDNDASDYYIVSDVDAQKFHVMEVK